MDEHVIAAARSALEHFGLEYRQIMFLSPRASGRKRDRRTLRAELADGSAIKVRCFESVEAASRLADVRRQLDPVFAPVVGRYEAMVLEAWIAGEELSPSLAAARAEDVGAILGRLHATALPELLPPISTQDRRDRAEEELAALAESGLITSELRQALLDELRRTDPGEAPRTLVHLDYCPENLVVDASGGLHVVDNEWIRIDASGLDLGRTWARWPMTADVWERFLRGYRSTAPRDPGPLRFWTIVMAVAGVMVRRQQSHAALAVPLARLYQLANAVSES